VAARILLEELERQRRAALFAAGAVKKVF